MLPYSWKPVPSAGLILIGPPCDGGYVVTEPAAKAATLLVSMGVNDDWRFEEDFRKWTGARIVAYDGTVDWWFWTRRLIRSIQQRKAAGFRYFAYRRFFDGRNVQHRKRMIGDGRGGTVCLTDILSEFPNDLIFLKMDIEGAEYEIFDEIVRHQDRIAGIAMELHRLPECYDEAIQFFARMASFSVVALRPNNWCGTQPNGDPACIEMTIVQKRFVVPDDRAVPPRLPPNDIRSPEIELRFEPA